MNRHLAQYLSVAARKDLGPHSDVGLIVGLGLSATESAPLSGLDTVLPGTSFVLMHCTEQRHIHQSDSSAGEIRSIKLL